MENCVAQVTSCYICHSKEVELYKTINGFGVNKCNECRLLWIEGFTNKQISAFYEQAYFKNNTKIGYKNYLVDEDNHRRNARNLLNTINKIKDLNKIPILDIGCAFGFLLDEARLVYNCDTYGIEVSNYAFEYAKNKLRLNVINAPFQSSFFEDNFFDVVLLIGTIEHLTNPKEVLRDINKILREDGLLIITTTDTKGILPLYSIKPPEHIFYFNNHNFSILLNAIGYEILLRKTYFVSYFLHDLFHRLKEFTGFSLFQFLSVKTLKYLPNFFIKIPTNEMLLIARKRKK